MEKTTMGEHTAGVDGPPALPDAGADPRAANTDSVPLRFLLATAPLEPFPAPREDDCAYGCYKAGDVGIGSELVRRA